MRNHPTLLAGAALATLAFAAPAAAQAVYDPATDTYVSATYVPATATVEEVVVPAPRYYGYGRRPESLSRAVSYRDLDLTTGYGRHMLSLRIRATAHDLCRALGESSPCVDDAVRKAQPQMRYAVNRAYATQNYAYLGGRYVSPTPYPYLY